MRELELLVVGTGRCGTVFMARILTSLGIPCGHESIFSFGGMKPARRVLEGKVQPRLSHVSTYNILRHCRIGQWVDPRNIVAESSYLAAPFLLDPLLENVPVIHVVRHPLKVVSSFVKDFHYFKRKNHRAAWEGFIYSHFPDLNKLRPPLEVACAFYVWWNEMIEKSCTERRYLFQKIEEMPSNQFFDFIVQQPRTDVFCDSLVNTNKHRKVNFLVDDIPEGVIKDQFVDMMTRYGYKPFSQPMLL